MKFRQTLTAAAAAAVLAPAAVLAAPGAAFATDIPGRPADTKTSQEGGGPESDGTSGRPGGATEPGGSSGAGEPATGTDGNPKPGTDTENDTPPAPGTGPGKDTAGEPGQETGSQPGQDPRAETGTTPGGSTSEDTSSGGECEVGTGRLQMAIKGMQTEFVAGADWSHSSLTLTNTSDEAMDRIRPEPFITSSEIVSYPYWELQAEIRDPRTGRWVSFDDAINEGEFTGLSLAAHSTRTLSLRIRAIDTAKPGDGYAIMEGTFFNKDGSCGGSNHAEYRFKILPAHGKPGGPGKSGKPGKPGEPSESAGAGAGSTGGNTPQVGLKTRAGARETAGAAQLAATGSSSALPTIALVGGVAMAVGAGAVITVRRRKVGGGTA
ncbi:LPXTG cell wall anchor domain-containing protein [Streptomyces sp. NPDC018045]|uniref:LPXTG cell wall anchor domain-containing protein n=1 Tax=Streptomyces sp. NPDC018045 TaxID=3365037 RepID=UPI0037A62B30